MVGLDTLICGAVMTAAPLALPMMDVQGELMKEVAVAVHFYNSDTLNVDSLIQEIDQDFLPLGFTLWLDTVTYDNTSNYWFSGLYNDSIGLPPYNYSILNAMCQGKHVSGHLNIYVLPYLANYVAGFSYIPPYMQGNNRHPADGVWMRSDYLNSTTLHHEIGHFFGLYHVFQGISYCGENADLHDDLGHEVGDLVHDTPPIKASWECDNPTCTFNFPSYRPWFGFEPNNYMDYLSSECRTSFTAGQIERMHAYMTAYRSEEYVDLGALEGDINGDGIIGTMDVLILLGCLNLPIEGCENADMDNNGVVSILDLLVVLTNYGL